VLLKQAEREEVAEVMAKEAAHTEHEHAKALWSSEDRASPQKQKHNVGKRLVCAGAQESSARMCTVRVSCEVTCGASKPIDTVHNTQHGCKLIFQEFELA
jgi:hypothetical protein